MNTAHPLITEQDLISIGILKRTRYRDLPEFIFVRRDGLFVPFRSERISELMGEEAFVLRADVQEEDDGLMTWQDLVGYTILYATETGDWNTIGVIADIDESTINTLATLQDGRMLPIHEDFIVQIDEDQHLLRLHLPFSI